MPPNTEKIREFFSSSDFSTLLLANSRSAGDPGFYWLSGLPCGHFEGSIFLARRGRKPLLLMPSIEPGSPLLKGISVLRITGREMLARRLKKELGRKTVGLDCGSISRRGFSMLRKAAPKANFRDVSKTLAGLRETKTRAEIAKIKTACRIAEECIEKAAGSRVVGKAEKEVARMLECEALKSGAHASFPPIVAAGRNSASPHSMPSARKIRRNEVLLVDFGARHDNYCSDITRAFFTGRKGGAKAGAVKSSAAGPDRRGAAGKAQGPKEVYSALYSTMEASIRALKGGAAAKTVFGAAESEAGKHGLKFSHALAHGIGVEVHDCPAGIGKESRWKIREGMALAVEPAAYLKGFGIRIEDDVVVGRSGCRKLSRAPKELPRI